MLDLHDHPAPAKKEKIFSDLTFTAAAAAVVRRTMLFLGNICFANETISGYIVDVGDQRLTNRPARFSGSSNVHFTLYSHDGSCSIRAHGRTPTRSRSKLS